MTPEETLEAIKLQAVNEMFSRNPYLRDVWVSMTPQEQASTAQTFAEETNRPEYQAGNIGDWLEATAHKLYDEGKLPHVKVAQERLQGHISAQDAAVIQNRSIPLETIEGAIRAHAAAQKPANPIAEELKAGFLARPSEPYFLELEKRQQVQSVAAVEDASEARQQAKERADYGRLYALTADEIRQHFDPNYKPGDYRGRADL